MVKLVLIDKTHVSLYHGKACVAIFELPDKPLSAEDVEYIRIMDIKEKA